MNEPIWQELKRNRLPQTLQLHELLFSDPKRAVFLADYLDSAENVREVQVRLFLEDEKYADERINRFLEAKYLQNSHVLRYIDAGTLLADEGTVTYAATEPADPRPKRPLAVEEALPFAQHVLSGLEYLHARNLVYCVLSPDTVVPVGDDWKLSDFSQLRVVGPDTSDQVLSLASTLDTSPPEAAAGLISPAWDIWSFGQTLRKLLTGSKANVPDAFRAVFLGCLHINPSSRPTLHQLSTILQNMPSGRPQPGLSAAARM